MVAKDTGGWKHDHSWGDFIQKRRDSAQVIEEEDLIAFLHREKGSGFLFWMCYGLGR